MGVGGRETKTIGYTCRSDALTIFGQGFNSPRLHHSTRGLCSGEHSPARSWQAMDSPLDSFVRIEWCPELVGHSIWLRVDPEHGRGDRGASSLFSLCISSAASMAVFTSGGHKTSMIVCVPITRGQALRTHSNGGPSVWCTRKPFALKRKRFNERVNSSAGVRRRRKVSSWVTSRSSNA